MSGGSGASSFELSDDDTKSYKRGNKPKSVKGSSKKVNIGQNISRSAPDVGMDESRPLIIIAAKEKGPGPGKYRLPTLLGAFEHDITKAQWPSYTVGIPLPSNFPQQSPGPIYYVRDMTSKGPICVRTHTHSWLHYPIRNYIYPGPPHYIPEHSYPKIKPKAPSYTFGHRTRLHPRDPKPAPNCYRLPRLIPRLNPGFEFTDGWTMASRNIMGSFNAAYRQSPGPAAYPVINNEIYKSRAPSYTMERVTFPCLGDTTKPSPNSYGPEKVTINRRSVPAYTMGIRHSDYIYQLFTSLDE